MFNLLGRRTDAPGQNEMSTPDLDKDLKRPSLDESREKVQLVCSSQRVDFRIPAIQGREFLRKLTITAYESINYF
jgi:hypothetical protein